MAAAENDRLNLSLEESVHAPHPTTTTLRPSSAVIAILHKCRQLTDDIQFNQKNGYPLHPCVIQLPQSSLMVQFVVAVEDKYTGEIWACNASSEMEQIYITRDGMFRIVPEVTPYAWMFSSKVDCRRKQLPPYAGNLTFVLRVKHDKPTHYAVRIQLRRGVTDYDYEVLHEVTLFITSHERGTNPCDFQSGRSVTEVEKPIPKMKMQGVLAGEMARNIRMHFQNLGDNGQYDQFLRDRQKLTQRVDGIGKFQDLLLAVLLEEAITYFGQNKMEECLATCKDVCERATRHNSGNWPFLLTKAFYIMSAVYRQAKNFDEANEYMEKSSECLERTFLNEETAVNRYNAAALLAEKSAGVGITSDEEHMAEQLFEDVAGIWMQQKENESMRCPIRSFNRFIMYLLKTSRTKFPDLRKDVSEVRIAKACQAIQKFERNLLPQCPRRLKATFLIGKADYFIRRATRKGVDITEQQRLRDLQQAMTILDEAMQISQELKMQKEIEGIQDRRQTIQALSADGLQSLNERSQPNAATGMPNEPREGNTNELEDFLNILLLEDEQNRRRAPQQCTD